MSAEKCSLTSAAAAAKDVMISWSRVRTTSCSSRRAPRTSSTCASSSLWRSSSAESSSRASGFTGPSAASLRSSSSACWVSVVPSGASGSGRPASSSGVAPEVARDVLVQRLGAQVDLVGLEVEGAGAVAHRIEPLLGRVAVLAQLLEALAAGPHGVDLVLVVVAQRLEDAVEPGVLLLRRPPRAGPARRPSASRRWRRDAAVARSSAWPCRRRSTSAWRSARTRRRSATPATRTSSSWRRPRSSARRSSSSRHASSASCSSGSDPASCACSAVTSASRCCAAGDSRRAPPRARRPAGAAPRPTAPCRSAPPRRPSVVAVGRPLGRGTGVAGPGQHDARLGQLRPGQLGRGGGLLRPAPRLLDRGRGHHAGARAHPPARGGETVALGRHHDQVVAGEREVDRLLPAVDAHGPADSVSRTDSATAPPRRARTWRRTGSALLPGGSVAAAASRPRTGGAPAPRPVTPRSRRVDSAAWAERRPSTTTAATPAPAAASKAASQPSSISTRSTSEPTTPSTSRSSSRPPAPCRSDSARSSASARAARAVARLLGLVGRRLGRLGLAGRRLELGGPRGQVGLQPVGGLVELGRGRRPAGRPAPRPPATRCSSATTRAPSASRSCCSRAAARATSSVRARTRAIAWSGASPPSTSAQRSRSDGLLLVERAPARPPARRARARPPASSASADGQLGGQACRLGLERRDHVDVGGRVRAPPPRPVRARAARPRAHGRARPVPAPGPARWPGPPPGATTARPSSTVASASSCSRASCSSRSSSRHTARLWAAARRRATRSASSAPAR